MTRQKPIELDTTGYSVTDFQIWHDLAWRGGYRSGGFITLSQAVEHASIPNRQYLIDKGYDIADIDRVAVAFDHDRYVSRYCEYFVPAEEREPELPVRDHLIDECGYPPEAVGAFLEKRAAEDQERARKRAEREAYEQTWRYRLRAAIREARIRVTAAWAVLRDQHNCEGEW
ncbi:hypothetical protein PP504_gp71 [Gordonia phage Dolores]|uniref:Uncharacterized protein n=2 Tax=Beenievirus TaxID=3044673 RepID=A0A514DIF8_9CAUD|nr:hypothetical protein PP503_gp70 [Gordonia phage Sekhmet]YP_010654238.1 hypothetical protein PP504_gp71 [Gordonia phage Dolores]QDH93408.1 hypothetical protein SEA_SEKHMET_70 [Gordonia phage Sekhmet]UAJ16501.1 hypothetical protein SEA_DOLORES_71 [Gordonia phage Dolores]URM87965.1 hypothetical protein SEA_WINKNICK_71 [Gordonia phage WinkNick]